MTISDDGLRASCWPPRLGSFLLYFDDDRWARSPQIDRMLGYRVLSQIHPDDYRYVVDSLYDARQTRQPFSSRHRIVDPRNGTRDVVMVGAPFYDGSGAPVGLEGYCIDVTPARATACDQAAAHLRRRADTGHTETQRHHVRAATQC